MSPARSRLALLFAFAAAVSACSGGGNSTPNTHPTGNASATPSSHPTGPTPTPGPATPTPTAAPAGTALPTPLYVLEEAYVTNPSPSPPGEIDVFSAGAVGTSAPHKLTSPLLTTYAGALAWGPGGNLYATGTENGALVVEYTSAQLTSGGGPTVAAQNWVANPNLPLIAMSFVLDSHGDMFVIATPNGYPPAWGLYEYPAGFTPSTVPTLISASVTGLTNPALIQIDASDNLYVANNSPTNGGSIYVFAASNPATAPIRTIGGADAGFSTVGSFVVGHDGAIVVFDSGTNEVYVFKPGQNTFPTIFQSSSLNWGSSPITVDANNTIYGVHNPETGGTGFTIVAFPAGASGVQLPLFSVTNNPLLPSALLFAR